jgi:hypothetical protein
MSSGVDPHHFDADRDSEFYLLRIRIRPDVYSTLHPDTHPDPNPDPSFQIKAQTLEKCSSRLNSIRLPCHLQIDGDPDHFDANPDTDPDPDFYLMRMRIRLWIQVSKMMRIHADPDLDEDPDLDADPDPQL